MYVCMYEVHILFIEHRRRQLCHQDLNVCMYVCMYVRAEEVEGEILDLFFALSSNEELVPLSHT